ncbi:alkaline D-peptidase [Penicillium argentinense]|uniref:Alkaline D-peptidase n=1 Tax=Penicillium argentinense TaxID=1131581 RepID=A0A9W9EWX4_9EURO|nr:alkaline D-peptidase [Penicillium argentinense]KAJ5089365.1 alkaline D-peptidase [Penicillium argentinense]
MRALNFALAFIPLFTPAALGGRLPGPSYPAPRDISSDSSLVASSWKNVTTTLDKTLSGGGIGDVASALLKNTTFSMGMFSLHDEDAQSLQYHHTALSNLNGTYGTKKVDSDTIYRIASISKLITTYAGMVELHEKDWNTPLTDIYPALKEFVKKTAVDFDAVQDIEWDKIAVGDIASHIGGIPRLGLPISSDFLIRSLVDPTLLDTWGLPPLNETDIIAQYPCLQSLGSESLKCSIEEYVQGIASNLPRYQPAASPLYSDSGFFLLGGALANLTGMSMDDLYRKGIFEPLGLKNTLSSPPSDPKDIARTVIATDLASDLRDLPITTPSGGIYSTINDLSKIGASILNSTLLPAEKTRRWMKPVSFTGDLHYALGRPWEIYRYEHKESGVVTNIYTKLGDSGSYAGLLVLVPDFDIGFTILGASNGLVHTQAIQMVADLLTNSLMPALMTQARHEALVNLAGTYAAKDADLNTTLTISVPSAFKSAPGLVITEWISNGTDIKNQLAAALIDLVPQIPAPAPSPNLVRLVPTISDIVATGQIAFQMETVNPTGPIAGHLFTKMYGAGDWVSTIDQLVYHDIPIDEFVFHVDKKTGKAHTVTPSAYNVELKRKS